MSHWGPLERGVLCFSPLGGESSLGSEVRVLVTVIVFVTVRMFPCSEEEADRGKHMKILAVGIYWVCKQMEVIDSCS